MLKKIIVIILFVGLIATELIFGHNQLIKSGFDWDNSLTRVDNLLQLPVNRFVNNSQVSNDQLPVTEPLTVDKIIEEINKKRAEDSLPEFKANTSLQTVAEEKINSIMTVQDWNRSVSTESLIKKSGYNYYSIGEAYYFTTSEDSDQMINYWYQNAKDVLFSKSYQDIGVAISLGQFQNDFGTMIAVITGKKYVPIPTPTSVSISETDLWNALKEYRKDHKKTELQLDENLCLYARQRTQELINRLKILKSGDSPLDAHAGFERDTNSGLAFTQTGFNVLAEDLAYDPPATSGVQIVEWGWDSSTPHRESLLSDEMTHGCVTGIYPIYVAELGRH